MIVSDPPSSMFRAAPKNRFGRIQRDRVDAARQGPARRRERQVVGARQAGDRVEQDDDVAAGLDLALGDLERHLGDVGVVLGRLVEGRGDDLALDAAAHVGDLLRSLADERDHEQDLRVVGADAVGDLLEQHRLAGLRRADDQGALALADRVDQVDRAAGSGSSGSVSRLIRTSGWTGVRSSKIGRARAVSVSTPLTESTRSRPQYFSASRGARTAPETRSPMRRPKRRTWLELT